MALSFIFDASKETPASVAKQRAVVEALMSSSRAPRNAGEGLNALGDGIVMNVLNRRADTAEQAGQSQLATKFNDMIGAGTFPAAPGAAPSDTVSAPPSPGVPQSASSDSPHGDVESYIRNYASSIGIDPDIAAKVAGGEGGFKDPYRHGEGPAPKSQDPAFGELENSFGPLQLYISGNDDGLGDRALAAGIDPRKDWQGGVRFALDEARRKGWGQWYGAKAQGITGMMGIGQAPVAAAAAPAPQQVASLDPSAGMETTAPAAPSATALVLPDQMQAPALRPSNPGAPQGPGAQGEIRRGADGKAYQYVQTAGMAGATGDEGWIPVNQAASAAPQPGEVGGPEAVTPARQRVLGTMMDKTPLSGAGSVVQALSAVNQQAPAAAAPSPVVQALAGATQPQQPAQPSPAVQKVAQALAPQQQAQAQPQQQQVADNLPVIAGGTADAIQPNQAGPSIQQIMQVAADPWATPEQKAMANVMLQQRMQDQDPLRQLQIQAARKSLAVPPKQWQKLDDHTLYDPASGETRSVGGSGRPMFDGNNLDAQAWNILQTADPSSREYATAYSIVSQPKTQLVPTENGLVPVQVPPVLPAWLQAPGGGPASPAAEAPAAPGPAGAPAPAPAPAQRQSNAVATPGLPIPGTIKEPNESEKNAMTFADRMSQSGKLIDTFGNAGLSSYDQFVRGNSYIPDIVENQIIDGDFQKFDQARRDFINAQLRRESGAVISPDEFDNANKQYFPFPGDPPELLAQKKKNRDTVINGMIRAAGPTYKPGAPGGASDLPQGVTEDDVQHTMKLHGLTRDQVLEKLKNAP